MALARITSAGENLALFSGIMGGPKAIWARGGAGAKMGSLKLKAILVQGKPKDFVNFAGPARTKVGEELGLIAQDRFDLCWIVDFPMFEWNEEDKKIDFSHNPFSMPNMDVNEFLALDIEPIRAVASEDFVRFDLTQAADIVPIGDRRRRGLLQPSRPGRTRRS